MGGPIRFESTLWSLIRRAEQKSETAARSLVDKYRVPVTRFIERSGFGKEDAEDLAQETFARLFCADVLAKADHSQGKFRTLLLAVAKNVMLKERERRSALKQGGGAKVVRLDPNRVDDFEVAQKDEDFDRLWMEHLLGLALECLKQESEARHVPYYTTMQLHLNERLSYDEIAKRLGKSEADVRNYLHRARVMLSGYVRDEIAEYSSTQGEFEEEVAQFARHLKPS